MTVTIEHPGFPGFRQHAFQKAVARGDSPSDLASHIAHQRVLDFRETGNGLHVWEEVGRAIERGDIVGPKPLIAFVADCVRELRELVENNPAANRVDVAAAAAMKLKMTGKNASVFASFRRDQRDRQIAALAELAERDPGINPSPPGSGLTVSQRTRQRIRAAVQKRIEDRTSE